MSKFIDKLNRISRGEPQPIGFTARQAAAQKPKIQLVASFTAENAGRLTAHAAGADAGLLGISDMAAGIEALKKIAQAQPDIIWGGRLPGGGNEDVEGITGAGGDFVVFSTGNALSTTMKVGKETGKILEVEASLSDGLLRTASQLPVDAILIARDEKENGVLTWQQLIAFQHLADLLTKPLLAPIPSQVTADELQTLWSAGVNAVVLEVSPEQPQDRLMKLRQEIDKLEFPSRRTRRSEVVAPRPGLTASAPAREDDDDDEDE